MQARVADYGDAAAGTQTDAAACLLAVCHTASAVVCCRDVCRAAGIAGEAWQWGGPA